MQRANLRADGLGGKIFELSVVLVEAGCGSLRRIEFEINLIEISIGQVAECCVAGGLWRSFRRALLSKNT